MPAAWLLLSTLLAQEAATAPPGAPLPEGNAFVRGLVQKQRSHEEALDDYTYDIEEDREELDGEGRVKKRRHRRFEVFYVRGRPLRKLVAEDHRPLSPDRQEREERKVREKAEAIARGEVATERPGIRLSAILERYDFRAVGRETVDERPAVVLDFTPRPGERALDSDNVLRSLSGRIWVDEAEQEVVRARFRNTGRFKVAGGPGASLSGLAVEMDFRKVDGKVWLPLRTEALATGRMMFVKPFRTRSVASYGRYRRFQVEAQEKVHPPTPLPSPPF